MIYCQKSIFFTVAFATGFALSAPISTAFAQAVYKWERSARHSFCQNFQAGREADGRKLFISQIERKEKFIGVSIAFDENGNPHGPGPFVKGAGSSWHIGKAGTHLKDGMTYSYGGKEKDVGSRTIPRGNSYQHYVFCLTNIGKQKAAQGKIKWVNQSNGTVPSHAVRGFNKVENHFVCRMNWSGGIHPGKLIPGSKACYIGYGGGEKAGRSYQVLVIEP